MKISVIILTYNREGLLPRAVASLLAQTFSDFELIIVDNGSTDSSGVIADEYAYKDKRIKVIHKNKGNIGSGRNAGLAMAQGEWVAFVDDDDFVTEDYLHFLYNLAVETSSDIAMCGATGRIYEERLILSAEDAMVQLLWRKYYNVQFPTKLICKSLFDGVRFSETAKYDDIELFPHILAKAKRVAYHGLAKYTFDRNHGGNNSAWTTDHHMLTEETLKEYLEVYRKRTLWLSDIFPKSANIWRYFEMSFMVSMVEKVKRLNLGIDVTALVEELRECRDGFINSPYALDFEKEWISSYV